jgi:RHH-type rel operon transcriptional repressor/antitoxin RelB
MAAGAVTIDLDPETLIALDAFAARSDLSRSALVNIALEEWLAGQASQIAEIEAGIADADAGRFATDAQVADVFAKYGVRYGSGP